MLQRIASLPLIKLLYVRHRNESVNDAHDRFIVNAALFYQSALKETGSSSVLLVTNDEGNQVSSVTLYDVSASLNSPMK